MQFLKLPASAFSTKKSSFYLADLPYSGMSGFSSVLSINCIFTEEEIDFVIFWIVTLWYQVSTDKSGIWEENTIVHVTIPWTGSLVFLT